ncbi:MAG TPA: c-type cytochrome [Gemmatimonadales bacterium]|nr:c-type cytochrome [Gemmatimonadales bacterium]
MWATNAKIVGIVLGTLALYTLIANAIPQVESEVPQTLTLGASVTPEQLVAAGEKVFTGIGGCTTCHGLGTRAPNLLTDEKGTGPIGVRCSKRVPGKSCKEYLYERLDKPNAVLLPGYEPIMPVMTKVLSPEQVWAVIAFLEAQGGSVDVTADDIAKSKQAAGGGATPTAGGGAAGGGGGGGGAGAGGFAGGSTDPTAIIQAAGCLACHKLDGQGQMIAPDLTHVRARRDANSIRAKILNPMSSITRGYEKLAGIMPKGFGTMMSAAQLEALVQFLAAHK